MRIVLIFFGLILSGCAHTINITPNLKNFESSSSYHNSAVGYYISSADRAQKVVKSAIAGDTIEYYPYKDLEPALQKILFLKFKDVKKLENPPTVEVIRGAKIQYAFVPEFSTESFTEGVFLWPPTKFTVVCTMRAFNNKGEVVWSKKYEATESVTDEERKRDFAVAPKKAAGKIFSAFLVDLDFDFKK